MSSYEDLLAERPQFSLLEMQKALLEKIVGFEVGMGGWEAGKKMRVSGIADAVAKSLKEL